MLEFHKVDICDAEAMDKVMGLYSFDCVIHFAGLKAVGESVSKPVEYYDNNMRGTFVLISAMHRHGVNRIIFSSSATVYGTADPPVTESSTVGQGITNPYGQTKFMLERVLMDVQHANPSWGVVLLRYFNPVGAHISGRIGEDPQGIPNNLMPYIQQVAVGRRPHLNVFGGDYDTRDGTAIRDYIHVVDLAKGHLAAMQWLDKREEGVCEVFNLGTGNGVTVLEMLAAMGRAAGKQLPHKMAPRRPGDLPVVYAVPSKAEEVLGWKAELGLERMCQDSWRWVRDNPMGFSGAGEKA
jgi:UDP-glucose 4-epimerase